MAPFAPSRAAAILAAFTVTILSADASSVGANRTVMFLEQNFFGAGDPVLTRAVNLSTTYGGREFQVLALRAWAGDYAPNETSPLPPPDANVVAAMQAARAASPSPLRIWGGVSLCPGRAFACMLNYTQANITGTQLAQRVVEAGLQGAVIYVSPYCNNPNCQRTTGKYAQGIATIVSAFNAAAPPGVQIALPLNEWDHGEIVAPAQPAAILSWQTVFYFTSIGPCQAQCGSLCGAGEGSTYVTRGGQNFTSILEYLAAHNITWLGQFAGVSTPDATNPPDFWSALSAFASGAMPGPAAAPPLDFVAPTQASPVPVLALPIIADWGGQGDEPFTRPGELDMANALASIVTGWPAGVIPAVLALGDNLYPMGACNNESLPPYNGSCPGRDEPGAGTAADPRFNATFESVFTAPALANMPFMVVAGNQDAIGNVSASIAYSAASTRWRHPGYWYRLTTQPVQPGTGWQPGDAGGAPVNGAVLSLNASSLPNGTSLDIFMVDVTLCYGVFSDPVHTAMCNEQLAWLSEQLTASTASFLFVAAHYPVWSGCAHGTTQWAVEELLPLLIAVNATGYMSGHDHCGQFLVPADFVTGGRDLAFLVAGTGEGCCYSEPNVGTLPQGALKFLLSAAYNPTNASAGVAVLRLDASYNGEGANISSPVVRFEYRSADANASLLYTSPALLPRTPVLSSNGTIVAMAAPDYAAAGLPRPSASAPAANYDPYQVTLWLYAPTAGNDTWASWYDTASSHRANLTGVAPCLYLLQSDGSFTTQMPNASSAAMARNWTARMATELGLFVRPLLAASGSGMNLLLSQPDQAATFINETITEAVALSLTGYNVQLEEPGNVTIRAAWLNFLATWLDAAAPYGLTISIIIGGDCRARDWMYMDCGDYKLLAAGGSGAPPRPNLRIITEATYTGEPSTWLDYLANIVRGVGTPLAAPGLEYKPPLTNPGNGCLPAAAAAGVRELYVWVDPPAGDNATVAAIWDVFGWWVSGAPNVTLQLAPGL